ncbi:MAG: hypothetical protein B7Y39_17550 [Bdellovibrio sp. 28-41-41]|nr:MAG: hypothetical protein B7Y39_17550 [Bdellovibrio sp. 28-41-41]
MKKFYAFLFLALALVPVNSYAKGGGGGGWLLGVDLAPVSSKTESTTSGVTGTSESSSTVYDISLGNVMGSGLYLGALYSSQNDKSDSSTTTTATAMGASVGFIGDSGFNIIASYILSATNADYKKGTGYQIDLGWRHFLSSSFYMGTKISMRSVKYTENETLSSGFESLTYSTTIPYVVLGFGF